MTLISSQTLEPSASQHNMESIVNLVNDALELVGESFRLVFNKHYRTTWVTSKNMRR